MWFQFIAGVASKGWTFIMELPALPSQWWQKSTHKEGGIARGSELGSWRAITTCPWPPDQSQTKARLLLNWILSIEPNTISNQGKSKNWETIHRKLARCYVLLLLEQAQAYLQRKFLLLPREGPLVHLPHVRQLKRPHSPVFLGFTVFFLCL